MNERASVVSVLVGVGLVVTEVSRGWRMWWLLIEVMSPLAQPGSPPIPVMDYISMAETTDSCCTEVDEEVQSSNKSGPAVTGHWLCPS